MKQQAGCSGISMKKHFVLVDYENVQPASVAALDREQVHILVFVGASQPKVSVEIAASLQQMGPRAEYVQISGSGKNALDFHIAFQIGLLAAQEPEAFFYIVSKDTGFDPLLKHLVSRGFAAKRVTSIDAIISTEKALPQLLAERVSMVQERLSKMATNKPRSIKTLGTHINAQFQKKLSDAEVDTIIQHLVKKGVISLADSKVSYL